MKDTCTDCGRLRYDCLYSWKFSAVLCYPCWIMRVDMARADGRL